MGNYHDERVRKANGILNKIKKKKGKVDMNDVIKAANKAFTNKKPDLKKLQDDYWAICPLSKKIEKALTGYLNRNSLDSDTHVIAYLNESTTVFMITAEAAINIKNSPEEYNPNHYLILHKRKKVKGSWKMWKGK